MGVWRENGGMWRCGGKRVVCRGVGGNGWYVEVWREKGGMWRCGGKRVVCRGVEGKGCGGKRVWREKGGM